MGVISDLVRMKSEKDTQAKIGALDALKVAMSSQDITPEGRQYAEQSMISLLDNEFLGKGKGSSGGAGGNSRGGGKSGAAGGPSVFAQLIGGISKGLDKANPYRASPSVREGIRQIGANRPQHMFYSQQEMEQEQQRQAEIKTQQLVAQQKAVAQQKREDVAKNYQEIYDGLVAKGVPALRASEIATAIANNRAVPAAERPAPEAGHGTEKLTLTGPNGEEITAFRDPKTGKLFDATTNEDITNKGYKVAAPKPKETAQNLAFQAWADKHGTTVDKMTAANKIEAIRDEKVDTRLPSLKSTGTGTGTRVESTKPVKATGNTLPPVKPGLDLMAWEFINSGHTGQTGSGKEAVAQRAEAIERAGELLKWLGIPPQDLPSLRGALKANGQALSRITTMGSLTTQFENTVEKNLKTLKQLDARFKRTGNPFLNQVAVAWNKNTGSSEALNYVAQLHAIANEWAKVMQGSTSAAGATVDSSKKAEEIMSPYIGSGAINDLFEKVILPDMQNRKDAINEEKSNLVQSLRGPQGPGRGPARVPIADGPNGQEMEFVNGQWRLRTKKQ